MFLFLCPSIVADRHWFQAVCGQSRVRWKQRTCWRTPAVGADHSGGACQRMAAAACSVNASMGDVPDTETALMHRAAASAAGNLAVDDGGTVGGRGGDSGGRKDGRPKPKTEHKEEAGRAVKKARPKPQSTARAF